MLDLGYGGYSCSASIPAKPPLTSVYIGCLSSIDSIDTRVLPLSSKIQHILSTVPISIVTESDTIFVAYMFQDHPDTLCVHIGRKVALDAQAAALVYINVRHSQIAG